VKPSERVSSSLVAVTALLVSSGLGAVALGALPPVIIGSVVPWVWVLIRRFGLHVGFAAGLLGIIVVFSFSMVCTAALGLPITAAIAVFALIGTAGVWAMVRTPCKAELSCDIPVVLASLAGSALWVIFQTISNALPAYQRLSWVMRNDSMTNLILARSFLRNDGILLGGTENPAPLPSGLVAIAMSPGRDLVPPPILLEHDLGRLALAWGCLIVLTCFFAGILSSFIAAHRGAGPALQVLAALLGSLAILSWYATGYPMEYGFINTHVFLLVAFSLLVIAISDLAAPAKTVAFAVSGTAMLAVWAPLSVVPLALLALTVIAKRRELLAASKRAKALVIVAVFQLVGWGLVVTLPTLLVQRGALAGVGGIYRSPSWVMFAAGIAVVVLDGVLRSKGGRRRSAEMGAVVTAVFAGLEVLLYISRRSPDPWTYYPVKFAWFSTILFIVILIGLLLAALSRVRRTVIRRTGLALVAMSVAVLIAWTPNLSPNLAMNPLDRLVRSQSLEHVQQLDEQILAAADAQHPKLLWHYLDSGDADVDLWLISLKADTLDGTSPLRLAAYSSYTDRSINQLCNIINLMGPNLTVITRDPLIPLQVSDNCDVPDDLIVTLF
jgi:hypothetical protein